MEFAFDDDLFQGARERKKTADLSSCYVPRQIYLDWFSHCSVLPSDKHFISLKKQSIEYLYWKGDFLGALELCNTTIPQITETSGVMWRELTDCKIRCILHLNPDAKGLKEAIFLMEETLLCCPIVDPGTHYFAASLYLKAGNLEDCVRHAVWFLREGARPTVYQCWNVLGEALQAGGMKQLGEACVAKACRIAAKMQVDLEAVEVACSGEVILVEEEIVRWIECKVAAVEVGEDLCSVRDL